MDLSNIQWTGSTWNPWTGCKKVSPGCKYCYMYRDKERYGQDPTSVIRTKSPTFNKPIKWNEEARIGQRKNTDKLIFTCSWSDWFIDEADNWRDDAWQVIRDTPLLTYQILTKRADRIASNLPDYWDEIKDRVWLGVSVETSNQVHRIHELELVDVPIRFVSFEPLLGNIELPPKINIQWFIAGGESGNKTGKYLARTMEESWALTLRNYAKINNIPFFMKQMGSQWAWQNHKTSSNIRHWDTELQVREFPV